MNGADVRIEALFGFRGESYAGQRQFTTRTNGKGEWALIGRDATIARPFFRRALDRDPNSFRAWLGMGSTALMQLDFDQAAKAFGEARSRPKDKDERSYLTAAINDLNKANVTFNRTGH